MGETVLNRLTKNQRIARTSLQTITRHRAMACKTYELKIDRSHLSNATLSLLSSLFLEAKWFYNAYVASLRSGEDFSYKQRSVPVKVKDRFEVRQIRRLSSQMRQELIDRARNNLTGLSQLKRNGRRVGALKFTSAVNSIPLKQQGVTYRVKGDRVWIQGVGRWLNVRGIGQFPKCAELASATLLRRHEDFFIHVTTYQPKEVAECRRLAIGVDCGVKEQLVFSNGVALKLQVPLTRRVKRLHRELSRRKRFCRIWWKTTVNLSREYGRIASRRLEIRRKVVSYLASNYDCVATQKDNVAAWQRLWGRRIGATAVGGIMSDLRSKPHTPIVVDRFTPTTKTCCRCGSVKEISLSERVYGCDSCGLVLDRNLNAAVNVWSNVPAVRREPTPVDMKAATEMLGYFNNIRHVSASLMEEAGSHPTFSRW
jgi:transposase